MMVNVQDGCGGGEEKGQSSWCPDSFDFGEIKTVLGNMPAFPRLRAPGTLTIL